MSADLIEIHVVFERPKSDEHMQKIANAMVKALRENIGANFARQRPEVYVADIRDHEDDDA